MDPIINALLGVRSQPIDDPINGFTYPGAVPKAGQQVPAVNAAPDLPAVANKIGDITQVNDAIRAARGQMTPEEQQDMAMTAAFGLIPGAGEAKPAISAAEDAVPAMVKAIRAYHGSPYDFNAFDLSKIGTGEGAQSYGHGLYFAENPIVAQSYKNDPAMLSFALGKDWDDTQEEAFKYLHENGYDQAKASADIAKRISQAKMYGDTPEATSSLNETKGLIDSGWQPPRGKMYEVNINADPEHFLDWDKPLSEQHPVVQKAVGDLVDRNIAEEPGWAKLTGQQALNAVVERAGQRGVGETSLRDKGIPGIKYLDQGSRGTQNGTRNYVVFDPKTIDIVKKYGLAGLVAGGASNFIPPDDQKQ